MIRVILGIIMFCTIIFGYWWMTWCLAILLLFYFPVYYEVIAWGVIYDSLYGIELPEFWNFKYIFTLFSILIFTLVLFIKKRLIIHEF